MFEIGTFYKDFEVIDRFSVSDYDSEAIHFRHSKTALEVVQFVNKDEENLFAFAFRTPNEEANGAAHILEHSVLCGSERFPLKDPFVVLSNQSVKTYLNALTYPDRTVFPASSTIRADFFNLLRVYGDAVFFPRLDEEIFLQEAHRLELDESGKPQIQGVVYNEMKGDYSSFESAVSSACDRSLLAGTIYEKDSGGDPIFIPTLTHEKLLDFHNRNYKTENCLVFFYGNIPPQENLDFLQNEFLDRIQKKYPEIDASEQARKKRLGDFLKLVKPKEIEKPFDFYTEGPSSGEENGNTVNLNWSFGTIENLVSATEISVLAGLLLNHDGSPLQKALIESNLGEDISPQTGLSSYLYHTMFSIGLRGVKEGDEKKVENCIIKTLKNLCENGIKKEDIEASLLSLEFSYRSVKRFGGPYSKTLMGRIVSGWLYGFPLREQICSKETLSFVRKKIESDEKFLPDLIKSFFLENPRRSLVVVRPSENFSKERNQKEAETAEKIFAQKGTEKINAENAKMLDFQQKEDDASLIPHLNPRDFFENGKPIMPRIKTQIEDFSGIPLFLNKENTNGIVYFSVLFPADFVDLKDYPLVPILCDACSDMGFVKKDGIKVSWSEAATLISLNAGEFGLGHITTDASKTERGKICSKNEWVGRDWLVYKIALLEENVANALDLLSSFISGADFSDLRRLKDILNENRNDLDSSIIPDGHRFAELRAKCASCHSSAVDEVWNGISQLLFLHSIDSEDEKSLEDLSVRLKKMHDAFLKGGALIHIIADENGLAQAKNHLSNFVADSKILPLSKRKAVSEKDFVSLTCLENESSAETDEIFATSSQVGFAAEYFPADALGSFYCSAESVCAHWLSNNLLWEKIRTSGGAYGAFASADSMPGAFALATYRDPAPFSSLAAFEECLRLASETDFSEESCEKACVGDYSHWISPQTPRGRGASALMRLLTGITDEDREEKLKNSLNLNAETMKKTFSRLFCLCKGDEKTDADFKKKRVVICGREQLSKENGLNNSVKTFLPI